jgi:hypothetical protein
MSGAAFGLCSPQNPHSLHIAVIDALEAQEIKETGNEEG